MDTVYYSTIAEEKTINIMVRVFHWSTVVLFITLFVSGNRNNGPDDLHIISGYLMISLLISRIVWGFMGNANALWKNYLHHPKQVLSYLSKLFSPLKPKFQLHNPAGSNMILAMMSVLLITAITGLMIEALFELDGVLLFLFNYVNETQAIFVKEVHSWMAHLMLFAIAFHLLGVLYSSYKYRVNMPLIMITGKVIFLKKTGE